MKPAEIVRTSFHSHPMHRARKWTVRLIAAVLLPLAVSLCEAESRPANDFARLLPSDAPVLAGLRQMPDDIGQDALWLATKNNTGDLSRFIALTNHDPSRRVDQVMVAAWASQEDNLGNHVLIAHGRFKLANLSRIAVAVGATATDYKGVRVVEVPPVDHSNRTSRWLAILRGDIAIYGTPAAVRYALDRHLANAPLDPQMRERLENTFIRDGAWSSVRLDSRQLLSRVSLPNDRDGMLRCLSGIHELELGIRVGKAVSIDLRTRPQNGPEGMSIQCLATAFFGKGLPASRVVASGNNPSHIRVALSHEAYDRWLDSFRHSRASQTLFAMISGPDF